VRARVTGVVQGVGFRPYVYGLATELGLAGYVLNDADGVLLEVEGPAVEAFLARLPTEAPPLAAIESVEHERVPDRREDGFAIQSSLGGRPDAAVAPDTATCDACLHELFQPGNRRFRYPFINCTHCGPRFTIVTGVPYDRPATTMATFTMCPACQAEYDDPGDRRFHAQPNACPACGPRLSRPLEEVVAALLGGAIVAVKGVGGFHLACRADDEAVVARLRAAKHREDRPFAVMVAAHEGALLNSPARPIVVGRYEIDVAPSVAPRTDELGVMLPYSPLHHLLIADVGVPLVMTSGNVSDEPIAFTNEDALERLAGIADLFLLHDRPIHTRTDDSVVRGDQLIRRSRGYVPATLPVGGAPPLLAVGAELKHTFALARDGRAWVSHHIGDLANYETLRAFTEGVAHWQTLFAVEPELVAHDLHPDYLSTRFALDTELPAVGVQHHHAHLAAVLAEHGQAAAAGAIYDGTGYGADGTIWGGELLRGTPTACDRIGHLWPVPMPGGEAAIREPWRMACAWLLAAELGIPSEWEPVARLARTGFASPTTTSMGRLFDAVAALLGLRDTVTYEGQAAVELESTADPRERAAYPLDVAAAPRGDGAIVLDARATIAAVVRDRDRGVDPALISARFHNAVARATAEALRDEPIVVLSGGVFQNALLRERTRERLTQRVLLPQRLPANDGGIAYGQAAIAAAASTG
jgi:hydrogenase maturation protein HypF